MDPASVPLRPSSLVDTVHVALGELPTGVTTVSFGRPPETSLLTSRKFRLATPETGSLKVTVHNRGPALTDSDAPARSMASTVGAVLSMVALWSGAVPVFPAASAWVAERARDASVVRAGARVRFQAPEEQVVVAGVVATPSISGFTVAWSPLAVPHVPPIEVMLPVVM